MKSVRRRDFLKWLGWAPVAVVAGGMAASASTPPGGVKLAEYTIRDWEPEGRDRYGANQPELGPDEGLNLYEPEPGVEYKWERVEPKARAKFTTKPLDCLETHMKEVFYKEHNGFNPMWPDLFAEPHKKQTRAWWKWYHAPQS